MNEETDDDEGYDSINGGDNKNGNAIVLIGKRKNKCVNFSFQTSKTPQENKKRGFEDSRGRSKRSSD